MRSLQVRRSTGIPALPNVKTTCSRHGIVPLTRQPSHREGHMPVTIGRREFIATLGCVAAWSLAVRAEQARKTHTIGLLSPATSVFTPNSTVLVNTLREWDG